MGLTRATVFPWRTLVLFCFVLRRGRCQESPEWFEQLNKGEDEENTRVKADTGRQWGTFVFGRLTVWHLPCLGLNANSWVNFANMLLDFSQIHKCHVFIVSISIYILVLRDRVSLCKLDCPAIYLYLKQETVDCQFICLGQIIYPQLRYSSCLRTSINWAKRLWYRKSKSASQHLL